MCGSRIMEGYLNIDKYNPKAELLMDILEVDFPDDSLDEVFWHHGMEHVLFAEAHEMLRKIRRWLKPGGVCFLGFPDIGWAAKHMGNFNYRIIVNLFYGAQEMGKGWEHKSGYDDYLLGKALKTSGWSNDEARITKPRRGMYEVWLTKK